MPSPPVQREPVGGLRYFLSQFHDAFFDRILHVDCQAEPLATLPQLIFLNSMPRTSWVNTLRLETSPFESRWKTILPRSPASNSSGAIGVNFSSGFSRFRKVSIPCSSDKRYVASSSALRNCPACECGDQGICPRRWRDRKNSRCLTGRGRSLRPATCPPDRGRQPCVQDFPGRHLQHCKGRSR